ncbi:MAG: PP2C family protein-serine/threonine phosphatase [Lachnospiraceae bacterium]
MLKYAVFTNIGGRKVNEDAVGAFEKDGRHCFVVCDGLGGHGMGEVASELVKKTIGEQFNKTDEMENFLGQAIITAQNILMAEQSVRQVPQKMKTTVVSLVADDETAYIGHVGDSRLYVFNKNKVKLRTYDHSIPQMLVWSGEIKEKEIRNHPDRNLVLRVMGTPWEQPMYELKEPLPLKKCQAFLLCTDGFWELIEEKEMCRLLKKAKNVEEWLFDMVEVVKQNGKCREMDNFSAIAVWKG